MPDLMAFQGSIDPVRHYRPSPSTSHDNSVSATSSFPSFVSGNDSTASTAREDTPDATTITELKAKLLVLRKDIAKTKLILATHEAGLADTEALLAGTEMALLEAEDKLARVTRDKDEEIQRLKDQLSMKRVVDSVLKPRQSPVTPPSRLRPSAPPFIPESVRASVSAPTTPTKQSRNDVDNASIRLSPSLNTLDDAAFENLILGRSTDISPTIGPGDLPDPFENSKRADSELVEGHSLSTQEEELLHQEDISKKGPAPEEEPAQAICAQQEESLTEEESKQIESFLEEEELVYLEALENEESTPKEDLTPDQKPTLDELEMEEHPAWHMDNKKSQSGPSQTQAKPSLFEKPVLELPTKFLSTVGKYRDTDARIGATVTQIIPSTSETAKNMSNLLKENISPPKLKGKKIFIFAPTNFRIRWNVNTKSDLYGDLRRFDYGRDYVRNDAAEYNNWFWLNGLRYTPEDPAEGNAFRTIMIEDIPIGTSSKEVLDTVIGGPLESFQLCDTSSISGFLTARIVYIYQEAAYDMVKHVRHLHLQSQKGIFVNGSKVHVVHLTSEATTPPPNDLAKDIYEYGFTRVLRLSDLTPNQAKILKSLLLTDAVQIRKLEEQELEREEGKSEGLVYDVEMRSVRDADIWKARLERDVDFQGAKLGIGSDPCDIPFLDDGF